MIMLGFVALGFRHAQRTPAEEELLVSKPSRVVAGTPS
jgi:hypothetical protein